MKEYSRLRSAVVQNQNHDYAAHEEHRGDWNMLSGRSRRDQLITTPSAGILSTHSTPCCVGGSWTAFTRLLRDWKMIFVCWLAVCRHYSPCCLFNTYLRNSLSVSYYWIIRERKCALRMSDVYILWKNRYHWHVVCWCWLVLGCLQSTACSCLRLNPILLTNQLYTVEIS